MSTDHQKKNDDFDNQFHFKIGEKLYMKTERADVYFVIESTGERIPAHKILLSSSSDVFEAMFYGSLKEEGDIKIVDASAEAIKEFLRFFYFGKVKLSTEHVAEVMYLSKKYNVEECLRLSADLLANEITTENVVSTLGLAITYDQNELQKLCELEIRLNSSEVFQSPAFLECDRQVLSDILNMDYLLCSEMEVFGACMSWVRAASKQDQLDRGIVQAYLGDLFYAIRFSSMSLDEFVRLIPSYGNLFSGEDYTDILSTISQPECQPKLFKGRRHLPQWDDDKVINCNRYIKAIEDSDEYYQIKTEEVTTFSTNKALLLGQFAYVPLYEILEQHLDKIENVKATVLIDSRELVQFNFDYSSSYSYNDNVQKLPNPIIVKAGSRCDIRLNNLPSGYKTRETLNSTENLENGIVVQFHNDPMIKRGVTGVIYKLGFNLLE